MRFFVSLILYLRGVSCFDTGPFKTKKKIETNCRKLSLECVKGSNGVPIKKNGCFLNEDGNRKFVCAYYTAKDCIDNCVRIAKDLYYVVQADCENMEIKNMKLVREGPCVLAPTCKKIKMECEENRTGREVLVNECWESRNHKGQVKLHNECIYIDAENDDV